MSDAQTTSNLCSDIQFEIGGKDQLKDLCTKSKNCEQYLAQVMSKVRIQTGTLLKVDTVSFLLGAGASVDCGGPLIGSIPLEIEKKLLNKGIADQNGRCISEWLRCFYLAARYAARNSPSIPVSCEEILKRREEVPENNRLCVNFEELLSQLNRWKAALPSNGGRLKIEGDPSIDLRGDDIDECLCRATSALAHLCDLPTPDKIAGLAVYRELLRKVLTRPLNLKRMNIFTLNYDTLIEQAADAEGIVLLDGFVGSIQRTFRPESYDHDLYFSAGTTEGPVHRLERVLHLYKLHGSINWTDDEPSEENPYGIRAQGGKLSDYNDVLIYPTPAKWREVLGMPYAELLRRFAATVVQPQSVLFVLGYGFGDEHIRAIVRQALAIPSFTLVIVDPCPQNDFVKKIRQQHDPRVWLFTGNTLGTFTGFVQKALADLQDEDMRRQVIKTQRALKSTGPDEG